jgi:hypothetical protein
VSINGVSAYASLKIIRLYLNIIYAIISKHSHDTNITTTLIEARCGSLPLMTFLFELLPSSNTAAAATSTTQMNGNVGDESKSIPPMDLNAAMPWKKVILLIRQLVLILVVSAPVAHLKSPNTPGTLVGGNDHSHSTATSPSGSPIETTTPTPTPPTSPTKLDSNNELSMPTQYGVKARLNDLRDACVDATLRFSPVSFFPGDRFSPPDFFALSDLPSAVRYVALAAPSSFPRLCICSLY